MSEYKDKEWLEQVLNELGSGLAISRSTGYPVTCVNRYIRKFGLQSKRNIQPNRKYGLNENYFECIDSEEKAYWFGFFMADGCMYHSKTSYDIQFSLAIEDISHLCKFKNAIESEKDPESKKQNEKDIAFFRVSSKNMYNDLLSHGGTPRKTGKEQFPSWKCWRRHFIRGMFDGDGSFYVDEDNYITCAFVMTCSNKWFLKSICEYFGREINLFEKDFNFTYQNGAWSMRTTSKEKCYKIYSHIYKDSTIYLDRKHKKIMKFLSEYSPQCE